MTGRARRNTTLSGRVQLARVSAPWPNPALALRSNRCRIHELALSFASSPSARVQMPPGVSSTIPVRDLALDLANYRMPKQPNAAASVQAMVSSNADRFWALTESLLDDGYLPNETILVLEDEARTRIVKEGNRRLAALKIILGQIPTSGLNVPTATAERIAAVTPSWKRENRLVPCTVYPESERATVDRIVRRIHGKGDKASRDQWNALARARYQRDELNKSEPGLDLLESYLTNATNVNSSQKHRWGSDFPLTVLDEAAKRLARRCETRSARDLAGRYPNIANRAALEAVIHAIGQEQVTFPVLRNPPDFAAAFGFPPISSAGAQDAPSSGRAASTGAAAPEPLIAIRAGSGRSASRAVPVADPRGVRRALRGLLIHGEGRGKLETLRLEMQSLDITRTPMTFCIALRTLFELSARAYCRDHRGHQLLRLTKTNGKDKSLTELLKDVIKHLVDSQPSSEAKQAMRNRLHGASTELARRDSLLSITSLNQVVHNDSFSITATDISSRFGNVLPALEELNA